MKLSAVAVLYYFLIVVATNPVIKKDSGHYFLKVSRFKVMAAI